MKSTLDLLEWDRLCEVVASFAESELGRQRALRLRPIRSFGSLSETAESVAEMSRYLEGTTANLVRPATDLSSILEAAHRRGSGLEPMELVRVREVLDVARGLARRFAGLGDFPRLQRRCAGIPQLPSLLKSLEQAVDASGAILDEAHPDLRSVRRDRATEEARIRKLAESIASRAELKSIVRPGPPVLRDGRFMLAVKAESRGNLPGVLHDRSSSGATVFIEPKELVEPQNRLRELHLRERNLIARVLLERTREVLRHEGEIQEMLSVLGSLDLVAARARYGHAHGCRALPVVEQGTLVLRQVYHPLLLEQELRQVPAPDLPKARQKIVPFDLELGKDFDVLVVTGPNTGGKTVVLKESVDESLLGGMVLRLGDVKFDSSVARELWRVGARLEERGSEQLHKMAGTLTDA